MRSNSNQGNNHRPQGGGGKMSNRGSGRGNDSGGRGGGGAPQPFMGTLILYFWKLVFHINDLAVSIVLVL